MLEHWLGAIWVLFCAWQLKAMLEIVIYPIETQFFCL